MKYEKIRFGDLYAIGSRNGLSKPSKVRGLGYKMINMGELFANDRIYDIPMELVPLKEKEKINAKVEAGDLLFARQSLVLEGAGKCSIVMEVSPLTVFESHLIRVRLLEEANPSFYYYYFRSALSPIKSIVSQCAQAGIRGSDLQELCVLYPPKKTQDRIANILEQYDNLIENNQKQIKLLEEAARRLYKEWFVDLHFPGYEDVEIVDGVPEGWTFGVLGDVAINSGKKEKKEKRDNYKYYLPIDCIPKKSLGYIQVNDVSLAKSSLIGFQKGDIIFGAMRPYFHKVVVARDKGLTRTTCFVLNAKDPSYWSYLAMLLFTKDTVDYATQISVGTTMPYVRWNDMRNMPVIIPDLEIAERFNKQIQPIIDNIASLSEQVILLQQARDRLSPKLMSGEIEV